MSEYTEEEMKVMLKTWRPPDAPVEAKSSFSSATEPGPNQYRCASCKNLKETNRTTKQKQINKTYEQASIPE